MDGGQTTWDNYDALNRRVLHVTGNYSSYQRFEYNADGRLTEVWQDEGQYESRTRNYGPRGDSFAYYTTDDNKEPHGASRRLVERFEYNEDGQVSGAAQEVLRHIRRGRR